MTDADWLAALRSRLDNAAERAAYADWLDERGDPRAEAVRLDLLLYDLPADHPEAAELRARLLELVEPLGVVWRAAACRVPLDHGEPCERPRWALGPPGPWYTLGVCSCEAARSLADGLLAWNHGLNRQPVSPAEHWRVGFAALACDNNVIRYGGRDPAVIALLGNHPAYCDFLIRDDPPEVYLDRQPEDNEYLPAESDEWELTLPELPAVPPPEPPPPPGFFGRLFGGRR